ncbi:MAG: Lacal_2735 family protein [Flavobacteriales bacterium]|nr:Lacal_2735 family protein [Flavobacteriales bacterium]
MFGLFKSKSPIEKLQKKYETLMSEAHKLSASDRKAGDAKYQEAEEVVKEIERLQAKQV